MASSASPSSARPVWLAAAAVLAAAYVLPLYTPPTGSYPVGDPTYFTRQFPGVPPAWIVGRLLALALAAVAFARALAAGPTSSEQDFPPFRLAPVPRPAFLRLACGVAALLLVGAVCADRLGTLLQSLFAALLPVPAVLTHLAYRRRLHLTPNRAALGCIVLFLAWSVTRAYLGWGDPRAATPVDSWLNFKSFRAALAQSDNLLTGRFEPGMPDFVHVLNGGSLLVGFGVEPGFAFLKGISFAWMAVTVAALFGLVRRMAGGAAALVAVCGLLFSPMTLLAPLTPMPLAFGMGMGGSLFALFQLYYRRNSPTALVALGALGGFAATIGHTVIPCAFLGAATGVLLIRRRHTLPLPVVATALLVAAAAMLPLLPDLATIQLMRSQYLDRFIAWPVVESVLLGQRSPLAVLEAPPERRSLEIALTAMLAPLATPRTPLRLWGDVFVEPITVVLAFAGFVALARRRFRGDGTLLLGFMLTAMLPGLTSSYDRPSLIRVICMPFLLAALGALGCVELTRLGLARRSRLAALLGGAIIASGWWLFDGVNRRIVPQSWVSIALEATGSGDAQPVVLLDFEGREDTSFLNVALMAEQIPRQPLRRVGYTGIDSIVSADAAILLWSPALEEVEQVGAALCARWPAARRLRLFDAAQRSYAWAAVWKGDWRPNLPTNRWQEFAPCPAPLE